MRSLRKLWLVAVMGGLALLCATSPAQAQPSLWLGSTDGGNSGVIVGGAPIVTPTGTVGSVNFTGPLPGSANLVINVTTGISEHTTSGPAAGSGSLDLNSVNVSVGAHAAAITLYIALSDTGFGPIAAGLLDTFSVSIGGTLDHNGTTSLTAWGIKDLTNTLWGGITPTPPAGPPTSPPTPDANHVVLGLGPFTGAGGFSDDASTSVPTPVPTYSLTELVAITFAASSATQTVSFDFATHNQAAVPEPSTMALAGLGTLGFITYGLRRRKASGA